MSQSPNPTHHTPNPVFRLALAQINPTVGALDSNTAKIIEYVDRARELGAQMVAFPELAIPGYPPEDLLFKPQFIQANIDRMHSVVEASKDITVVVGFADDDGHIRNSAAIAHDGKLLGIYHKVFLPNYGVFDEERYFRAGDECPVFVLNGTPVGINICEDIWSAVGPTTVQQSIGANVVVNISASPFHAGKRLEREKMLVERAVDHGLFVAYLNTVGGQDELVFDGASVFIDPSGNVVARGSQFAEELVVADLDLQAVPDPHTPIQSSIAGIGTPSRIEVPTTAPDLQPPLTVKEPTVYEGAAEVYTALVTGTRDYVKKSGFDKVLIAISGGIDSSLVAAVAADALGPENVVGIWMPSRYSSENSMLDATALAENLGIELRTISIEEPFSTNLDILKPHFEGTDPGLAEENLQSRIRGVLIMALSNKFGWMVLTTGNKSEMAVGYATIYGDMAGGYGVIKDVPKTLVFELSRYRNTTTDIASIPQNVIAKPPSAELRQDQKDEDSLPPYDVLDPILEAYVEDDRSFSEITAMGYDERVVIQVIALVDRSEYKRRQAPPGIKITTRNFGRDRRMPIVNRYRPY
ncbi:MAG: NAD+ synthase [SAR202 cluster bacterium]|nr:NAD+ synthase [SAR202 cluster bacterium]